MTPSGRIHSRFERGPDHARQDGMCRLLGILAAGPMPFVTCLRTARRSLASVSHEHPDGWGAAVLGASGAWSIQKPPLSEPAAHPNARFTVSARQCPSLSASFDDPYGVPISAILFGGRRARVAPLVYEARDWAHGVYVGATLVSETTAAATGDVGVPRNDPMAMLPFCGYNMGEYFGHWLSMGRRLVTQPRIFHVNGFRTDDHGKLLWPGFGDNIRVLHWIMERIAGRGAVRTTPIGNVPSAAALDVRGLGLSRAQLDALLAVDPQAWLAEIQQNETFLRSLGDRFPAALRAEHEALRDRLRASIS